jgi:hypothetical protein
MAQLARFQQLMATESNTNLISHGTPSAHCACPFVQSLFRNLSPL